MLFLVISHKHAAPPHSTPPLPTSTPALFLLSLANKRKVLKVVVVWAISGVTQFSWVSPMYTGGLHVIKLQFVFFLLIYLLLKEVSAKKLEGERQNYVSSLKYKQRGI